MNKRQDSPLQDKIKLPNIHSKAATIGQVSAACSLSPILQTAPFMDLDGGKLTSVMTNLWKAVKQLCPEPFEEVEEKDGATDYVVLKTAGAFVAHQLLSRLLPYCPRKDRVPMLTTEVFKELLSFTGDFMQLATWRMQSTVTASEFYLWKLTFSNSS